MTYIEREALPVTEIVERKRIFIDGKARTANIYTKVVTLKDIEAAPAADAVPVTRSTWEVAIGYDPRRTVQCQNCFKMAFEPSEYCPACGAKMAVDYTDIIKDSYKARVSVNRMRREMDLED